MKSTFDELKDLIDYIQSVYTEITDEWLRETPTKTNLKNALVADIDADGTYPNRYRCIDSSKFDYKAVHLYFKENNQSFPWELQIWNMCDMDSNFSSHKKYKQEYTAWEKESKEGGIIND